MIFGKLWKQDDYVITLLMIFRFTRTKSSTTNFVLIRKITSRFFEFNQEKLVFKHASFFFLLFFLPLASAFGQIAADGLNNSTTLFTLSNGAYYTGNSAASDGPATSAFASEGTHSRGVSNANATLTSSDINTSSYTGVAMSFRLASFSIGATTNGADGTDIVTVEISPNGGTNWYSTVRVLGNSNAYWAYSATGTATTAYDGNATPVDFTPAGGGSRSTDGYSTVSVTGLPVTTNLRVRITLLNNAAAERWVIDDFKVTGTIAAPCSGTPTPGNTVAATNPVVSGGTTLLSMSGTLTGSGLTYQWQQSADGVTGWANVSGVGTNTTYTATPTGKTWYKCVVTCSGSSAESTPVEISMAPCTSNPSSNDGAGISSVTVGSATFAVADVTYLNYTSSIPNLTQGASVTSSVTFATGYAYATHIWIDFNDDGVFNNTNEKVFSGESTNLNPTTLATSFTLSGSATVGQHRMRIGTADDGQATPTPCYSGTYGVTIDLVVNVVVASVNPVLGITGTTAHGSTCPGGAASSQTYTITNTGGSAASGITVVSSDPQFVVSGLSSTTIAGSGGTATYVVTFTPSSAGAKTATITVASTTSGSNSPTSNLTGTGTATVSPVAVTAAATAIGAYGATLGATSGTTFGVCPTTSGKGFVISQTSVNATPTVGGTGAANETVTPLGTTGTAYTKALTGLLQGTNYSFRTYVFDGVTYTYGNVENFTTLTAPANDLCGSATNLVVNTTAVTGTLVASTVSSPFSDFKDVWYQFTPDCIGKYTITVGGFTGDVDIQLFSSCATSTALATVSTTANPEILVSSTLSASTTYYVRVRAFNATAESSTFNIALSNQMNIFTHPSNASATSGTSANFASSMPANATGYQWQVNTGSSWVNVSTGTGGTTNAYATENTTMSMNGYQYRVVISNGTCNTVTSNPATLTVTACTPVSTNSTDYIISFATTGGITNISNLSSGASSAGYGNFYGTHSVSQEAGQAIGFSETYQGGSHGFNIWVDWDNDGSFSNAEKVYASGGLNGTGFSGSFSVPNGTTPGDYRMRIRAQYNTANPDFCNSISWGEAEDYKLIVTPSCTPPTAPSTPTSNSPQCLPTGVTVSKGSAPAGETWYWQTTATGMDVAAVNSAATYTVTTPGTSTIYLRSRNNTTLCWSTASSVSVTVNAITSIATQPANQLVYVGTSATFSVVADGGGLNYQWQINTGSGFVDVTVADGTGGATASFTTVATTLGMTGYKYRVIITGACGNATSDGLAELTVSSTPLCAPVWEENFDYGCASNDNLKSIAPSWTVLSGSANDFKYSAATLSYTGYTSSGIGGSGQFRISMGDDIQREINPIPSTGSVYASFLLQMADAGSSDYFISFRDNAASPNYSGRVYMRKSGTQYQLGIVKGTGTVQWSSMLDFNATYLVVLKNEFVSGGTNDVFKMWIIPSGIPANEAAAGTPIQAVLSDTDPQNGIKHFALRQTGKEDGFIDGIRIATTWSDAVCGGPTVAPTSVTYTWTGNGSSTSWENACNWSPRGIPGATDNIIINTSPTFKLNITDTRTVKNFTLNGTGHFNMSAAGILNINGDVAYGGTATATLNCDSYVYIKSTSSQPIPPLNYGNLDAMGGNRIFPNGGTIGICNGFNVDPTVHTYTVAGSTVNYSSTGTGWVMISFTYHHLTFSGTGSFSIGGYISSASNKTINVLGDFTQSAGTVSLGNTSANTATLNVDGNMIISGGTFNINVTSGGSGIINLKGNLTVNGGILTSTQATNAHLKFIGTGQQDVSLAGSINNIYNVEINKASGVVNLLTKFQPKRTLTMTRGNIVTNANILELGESATNTTKGTLAHTSGYVIGNMKRWFNGANSGDASSLFPLGHDASGVKNRFAKVEFASGSGALTANFVGSPMGSATLPIAVGSGNSGPGITFDITSTENQGYWDISNTDGNLASGTYTMTLIGEDFSTVTDVTKLALLKRANASANWFVPGTGGTGTTILSFPAVQRTGMSTFSHFGFGGADANPLPVELLGFSAVCAENGTSIKWSTASEKNSDYFVVEVSKDLNSWSTLSELDASGNSTVVQEYELTDENQFRGTSYYRLVQVDLNGAKKIYNPASINCQDDKTFLTVYPNPSQGAFSVEWNGKDFSEDVQIKLTSATGALLDQRTVKASSGVNLVQFDEKLEAGVYYITLSGNNSKAETVKLVVR